MRAQFCILEQRLWSFVVCARDCCTWLCFIIRYRLPDPVFCLNHASTIGEGKFVSEEIAKLVVASRVLEVSECSEVWSSLLVFKNSDRKERLVLDSRIINHFLPKYKFTYEWLNLVPDMCSKGNLCYFWFEVWIPPCRYSCWFVDIFRILLGVRWC